ncbi:DNA-3-methyladenine glycosylase family protein [Roseococcus pinisoli]|uniref:DNA-3-methyladenine glycosylase II n=1 Tax=Roseococcus pinisoli TaxID=2835040 RepID=A0ABS5QAE3_9PROT|nr:DNA-3-methyladenine glycosylase [Roseococcus pinisoli]MBS7810681.1 DNA-3-methyladenine glycosylase 2 family protein [Roseococcus pinisoli]
MADWQTAERRLLRDKTLRPLIQRVGPCTMEVLPREPYEALVQAIAHQQVHARAAEAILGRFAALYPHDSFPPPRFVLDLPPEALRGCGFSGSKVAAIRDIAEKTVGGLVPSLEEAAAIDDETLIRRLVAIRGVGQWTVEMMLMFTLGRTDILPVDDFGVRDGWKLLTGAETQLKPKELAAIGEAWKPWRSVAAWYLWRASDEGKKRKAAEAATEPRPAAKRVRRPTA